MKTRTYEYGLTLVEIMIVVAVIAILATMVIGVASRIDTQTKENGVESIFGLLDGALQEYREFTGGFPEQIERNFANAPAHSEYLYNELSRVPDSQRIMEKINDSLIENKYGAAGTPMGTSPEIYDPWGTALDYIYKPGDNFPQLVSAGPDRNFGNADDMSNR